MRRGWLVGLITIVGCGSSPTQTIASAKSRSILLVADFTPPQPPPIPGVIAALQFAPSESTCAVSSIAATLDDVPLAVSPNATGSVGDGCQAGFFLTATPPAPGAQSTLRFRDSTGEASLTVTRLLEARGLTGLADGDVVHAGDQLALQWSTDSDQITTLEVLFFAGAAQATAVAQAVGTTLHVTVPVLANGTWSLQLSVFADPPIVACAGAESCTAEVFVRKTLSLSVQ
jgi:hypothetical protein